MYSYGKDFELISDFDLLAKDYKDRNKKRTSFFQHQPNAEKEGNCATFHETNLWERIALFSPKDRKKAESFFFSITEKLYPLVQQEVDTLKIDTAFFQNKNLQKENLHNLSQQVLKKYEQNGAISSLFEEEEDNRLIKEMEALLTEWLLLWDIFQRRHPQVI